ncbi:MAG: hypothetical protein Q8L48_29190 [Archangium sp.]|nr:hypothetical protein [Archangium sp.]
MRVETRETPVETGLEVPFVAEGERRWDFGDQSPAVTARQTTHAFSRAGRYVVRSYEGESLREQVTLVVSPRAAFHLVPPDARFAVIARGLEDFAPAVDFGERLAGPESTQSWLDGAPLLGWAFEQASAGNGGLVDAREGLATFAWEDADDTRLSVVGITDGPGALAALKAWLVEHGWAALSPVQGLWRYEQETRALDVFVDRGALYAVDAPLTHRLPGAQARIAAAPARGLESDGAVASALDQLPSGGLVLFSRAPEALSWRFVTAAVRIAGDEARLEGRLHGPAPLWAAQPSLPGTRLLSHAPEGPVLVAAASLPPSELAALWLGAPGTPRRKQLELELLAQGTDVERAVAAFAGVFELCVYADVPGFVRTTLQAGGRPQPQGTVLFEAPVVSAEPIEALADAMARRWELTLTKTRDKQLRLWRGPAFGRPLEAALTEKSLFAKAGSAVDGREPVDLNQVLSSRFDGAFTPGHVSIYLDVGQLRRELLQPRLMPDVDPRRQLTAQALAVTLLDRLSQLDSALFDLSPAPEGATIQAVLRLRPRE